MSTQALEAPPETADPHGMWASGLGCDCGHVVERAHGAEHSPWDEVLASMVRHRMSAHSEARPVAEARVEGMDFLRRKLDRAAEIPEPRECPQCGSGDVRVVGMGVRKDRTKARRLRCNKCKRNHSRSLPTWAGGEA